jgi:NADPH:quinone reductase-like Zn-dependent oxidoreductase
VIATVSSAAKAAAAEAAGAAQVIDYRTEDVAGRVMDLTAGAGVDRIVEVDFGANVLADVAAIAANGVIASYSSTRVPEPTFPYYPLAYKGVTLRLVQAYILPTAARAQAVADITRCLESGALRATIASTFSLDQTAAAHARLESGQTIGNLVVRVSDA